METLQATLVREPLTCTAQDIERLIEDASTELMNEAEKQLGYQHAARAAARQRNRAQLAQALLTENIQPFTKESVDRYQKSAVERSRPRLQRALRPFFRLTVPIVLCCFFAFWVILAASIVTAIVTNGIAKYFFWAAIGTGGVFALCLPLGIWYEKWDGEWRRQSIKEYDADVPARVLRTALRIKRHAPNTEFYVERLEKKVDPFLVAVAGGNEYYVDVWDEQDFVPERQPATA